MNDEQKAKWHASVKNRFINTGRTRFKKGVILLNTIKLLII